MKIYKVEWPSMDYVFLVGGYLNRHPACFVEISSCCRRKSINIPNKCNVLRKDKSTLSSSVIL